MDAVECHGLGKKTWGHYTRSMVWRDSVQEAVRRTQTGEIEKKMAERYNGNYGRNLVRRIATGDFKELALVCKKCSGRQMKSVWSSVFIDR
jgi:hypothetical protein